MKKPWFRKNLQYVFLVVLLLGAVGKSYALDLEELGVEKVANFSAIGSELVKAWKGLIDRPEWVRLKESC